LKILIYSLNFLPELTGIGKYSGEMVEWLTRNGHEVRVITSPPYYPDWKIRPDYSAWRYRVERHDGARVYRAPLWVPHQPGGVKRMLHLISFTFSSIPLLLLNLTWKPQIVWVVAPAFFCAPGAWFATRLVGARCWLHIQDFEVDAAFELGLLKGRWLRAFALVLERWLLRRFDRVSSISLRMIEHLHRKGVSDDRIVRFPNWVDIESIHPIEEKIDAKAIAKPNRFRVELQIAPDAVVALYSGNMGAKQGLEILAKAAKKTYSRQNLIWVFCGDGAGRGELEKSCAGMQNVRLLPLQPIERLNELLNLADIHLLPQRADVADLVMPSKLTGILASGRPVVATARPETELAKVLEGCGIAVATDDVDAFCCAVLALADDAKQRNALGRAARSYAEANFSRDAVLSSFEGELLRL